MYFFSKNKNLEKTARLRASINQCLHSKIVDASVDVETRLSACRGGGVHSFHLFLLNILRRKAHSSIIGYNGLDLRASKAPTLDLLMYMDLTMLMNILNSRMP